jgi:hypothetical protein
MNSVTAVSRQTLTFVMVLVFGWLVNRPAHPITPAPPQYVIYVYVHGTGSEFVLHSLERYGSSAGLHCAYDPGTTGIFLVANVQCSADDGKIVINAFFLAHDHNVTVTTYSYSATRTAVESVLSKVLAAAKESSEVDRINCFRNECGKLD